MVLILFLMPLLVQAVVQVVRKLAQETITAQQAVLAVAAVVTEVHRVEQQLKVLLVELAQMQVQQELVAVVVREQAAVTQFQQQAQQAMVATAQLHL
jgi:hypothetical protein